MGDTQGTAISGIGQIGITVKDLERSTAFYRDVLCLKLLFQAPGMSFFDLDGVRLMLGTGEPSGESHQAAILYYRVGDIAAAFDAVKARGAKVKREPRAEHRDARHELWLAFFEDPDGNTLALMSEVPAES